MPSALKVALEDLLKAQRLSADGPPLRGEDRRATPLATGVPGLDALIFGGLPRGQVSEIHGPASSGRTGIALAVAARATRAGALAAWIDPRDRLDPRSARDAGIDLGRLLWLRGEDGTRASSGDGGPRAVLSALSAVGTVLGSGLFELVVVDLGGIGRPTLQRLPGATWIRLQRALESQPGALLVIADAHVAHGPAGVSLALRALGASWSGAPGPGRLLRGLTAEVRAGRQALRGAAVELRAGA
jgi:RecA DNA recombination protein